MNKVLYITDSLGIPRNEPEKIADSKTWVSLLSMYLCSKNDFLQFYNLVPGLHSSKLVRNIKDKDPISVYTPHVILLQIGIVDCYPRALKEFEYTFLLKIPILRTLLHKIIKLFYHEIVKFRKISYVNIDTFRDNMLYIRNHFKDSKFIVLPIAPANNKFKEKNPIVEKNIKKYNLILHEIFENDFAENIYMDIEIEKLFIVDNHHLSEYGHNIIFTNIKKSFLKCK